MAATLPWSVSDTDRRLTYISPPTGPGVHANRRSIRVLRFLASLGVFNEQPHGSFGLTVMGERLRGDVPASMRSWALLVERAGAFRAFEPILETVRTGRSGFELAHGMPLFEYLA